MLRFAVTTFRIQQMPHTNCYVQQYNSVSLFSSLQALLGEVSSCWLLVDSCRVVYFVLAFAIRVFCSLAVVRWHCGRLRLVVGVVLRRSRTAIYRSTSLRPFRHTLPLVAATCTTYSSRQCVLAVCTRYGLARFTSVRMLVFRISLERGNHGKLYKIS